ncbi:hypothetical protein EGR_03796 [Echinococcus granulosus]|uniref:Uncharacterized protein n=1 Tax=Echinococcus granulosus TaxID=6210 RepID=W6UIK5_ECHGR|nr:hypothetical protein EGR_03796 [Echinococcus granulosus]EUB61310.1 hypothetical protein EGR_03796 [Echinococcus granulosus]
MAVSYRDLSGQRLVLASTTLLALREKNLPSDSTGLRIGVQIGTVDITVTDFFGWFVVNVGSSANSIPAGRGIWVVAEGRLFY